MEFKRFEYSVLAIACIFTSLTVVAAYDSLDPHGSINIKWDVMSWTADGYVALLTINNIQMYRSIMTPDWTLGWMWAKKEVIWSIVGAQATDQGDCSKFKNNIPHCCRRNPVIVDLLPGVPMNQQFIYIVAKVVNSPLGAKTLPQLFLHFSCMLDSLVPQIKQ